MKSRILSRTLLVAALGLLSLLAPAGTLAGELLVADRLTNNVYRYSDDGTLLGALISPDDAATLDQLTGVAVSKDRTKLYVANFGTSGPNGQTITVFDYDYAAGTATNPQVFADAADGISAPNSIRIGNDGTIYVTNLNGTGLLRFNSDGSSAGPPLFSGGPFDSLSGADWDANGNLLVADFGAGTVLKTNAGKTALEGLVPPNFGLIGASGVLVNGNDLYVSGMFTGSILKFDATTGAQDLGFQISLIDPNTGNQYPQGLILSPDGNGFLVGVLGFADGEGRIEQYGFDGQFIRQWAVAGVEGGFSEATAFAYVVPEPASIGLLALASVAVVFVARRRRNCQRVS
jgi:DNA-binding beta-propeller fold protein YncE